MIDEKVLIERLKEKLLEYINKANDEMIDNGHTLDFENFFGQKIAYENTIEIVKDLAEEHNNDFCEWEIDGVYLHSPHKELFVSCLEEEPYRYTYCPVCGKKIKAVDEPYRKGGE